MLLLAQALSYPVFITFSGKHAEFVAAMGTFLLLSRPQHLTDFPETSLQKPRGAGAQKNQENEGRGCDSSAVILAIICSARAPAGPGTRYPDNLCRHCQSTSRLSCLPPIRHLSATTVGCWAYGKHLCYMQLTLREQDLEERSEKACRWRKGRWLSSRARRALP